MSTKYRYFLYDGIACRIKIDADGLRIDSEGYFVGKGFCPVSLTHILHEGQVISERKFKKFIANQIVTT